MLPNLYWNVSCYYLLVPAYEEVTVKQILSADFSTATLQHRFNCSTVVRPVSVIGHELRPLRTLDLLLCII